MLKAWQVGDLIQDRWEIYRVHSGGAGVVYIVYDHRLRAPFAAKTFLDELNRQDPSIADRFAREAQAWTRLDAHPNVVQARMVEIVGGRPFVFLEYVSGGDLSEWIGTPRLTEDLRQVILFCLQFCDGMIHAASRGIRVHRDVKPRNCMVTRDRVLKITDFGLAKLRDPGRCAPGLRRLEADQLASVTMSGVGTCTHMAPEQFHDARNVDVRADVYSFGVMLYQMLTGELPFTGESWGSWKRCIAGKLLRTSITPTGCCGSSWKSVWQRNLSSAWLISSLYARFWRPFSKLSSEAAPRTPFAAPL